MIRLLTYTVALGLSAAAVNAATLGLPIFKTGPAMLSVVNQFDGLQPTPSYTLSYSSTIVSSEGAPELVGQPISMSLGFALGFDDGTLSSTLTIGGENVLPDPSPFGSNQFNLLPLGILDAPGPVPGTSIWTFTGIFQGFGPTVGAFPDVLIDIDFGQPLPTKTGYLYCSLIDCSFENTAGLTDLFGEPVISTEEIVYVEGQIPNAVLTFSTVGGPPPAPVPLPAGGLLLGSVLLGLGGARLTTRSRHPSAHRR